MSKEASKPSYLASIQARDPAAPNKFYILLFYPSVKAMFHFRIASFLWRKWHLRLIPYAIMSYARWISGIEIHPAATIGKRLFIDHGMGVVIGETAVIGDDVTLYHGVTLGGVSLEKVKRHPTLEDNVLVGAGATLLGPITIGKGSKVSANATIRKSVPAGMIAISDETHIPIKEKRE